MKFRSILYGSGKAGNIVGAKGYNGEYIVRVYQPDVRNPRSIAQQTQRQKAACITSTMNVFKNWARTFLKSSKRSAWSELIRVNLPECITGTLNNFEVDWTKAVLSKGSLDLPYTPQVTADGTTLNITWADNTGLGNAYADDAIAIAAYNADKKALVYNMEVGTRSERNGNLVLPTAWTGDTVNVWMACKAGATCPDKNSVSDSSHLGVISL